MATYAAIKPAVKPGYEDTQEPAHKVRITLSSKNVKNLEKGLLFFLFSMHVFLLIWWLMLRLFCAFSVFGIYFNLKFTVICT